MAVPPFFPIGGWLMPEEEKRGGSMDLGAIAGVSNSYHYFSLINTKQQERI